MPRAICFLTLTSPIIGRLQQTSGAMEVAQWSAAILVLCACWICSLLLEKWWRPLRALHRQGIRGPGGNVHLQIAKLRYSRQSQLMDLCHDILDHATPDYVRFSKEYGVPYYHWVGGELTLVVKKPEIVRDILSTKAAYSGRSPGQVKVSQQLLGEGLLSVNGEEWSHHRRVVSPAFHLEKLKIMTRAFVSCTSKMLESWEQAVSRGDVEIEIFEAFGKLTADIISHTAFGSNYEEGRMVFENQTQIGRLMIHAALNTWLPFGSSLLPTKVNLQIRKAHKEIDKILLQLIQERRNAVKYGRATSYGDDLLGLILEEAGDGSKGKVKFGNKQLIGECKTFYLAGQETTAVLLTWTIFLLARYPEWQERAREEVMELCGGANYDADSVGKMKQVAMILNESLRLYPPVSAISRGCFEDMYAGDLFIPKGTSIQMPIVAAHHDEKLWGPDVHEFKPERFANGASKASVHPNAFMPFSFGPRVCVGQSFALMEAKVVLAMLLSRFSFKLAPGYRHCPIVKLTLKPHHGMNMILTKL